MIGAGAFVLYMAWAGGSGISETSGALEAALDCHIPVQKGLDYQIEIQDFDGAEPSSNLSSVKGHAVINPDRTTHVFKDESGQEQKFVFSTSRLDEARQSRRSLSVKAYLAGIEGRESRPVVSVGYCQVVGLAGGHAYKMSPEKVFSGKSRIIAEVKSRYRDLVEVEEVRVSQNEVTKAGQNWVRFDIDYVREPQGPSGKAFYCTKGYQYELTSERVSELQESCDI